MKLKLFKIALSLLIIYCSNVNLLNQQHIAIKWPEIENELVVNEYQNLLIALANAKLNVTALPKDVQEDGEYIMTELRENLDECRNQLLNDHSLPEYKKCVHQKLDISDDRIWDLIELLSNDTSRENDDDDDSGSVKLFDFKFLLLALSFMAFNLL